ncbi:hypothetical protein RM543_14825 [Roseicyclus sp. F158]|uniref:HAMP domain-containing protein n=1 Tax=Tropicimonas omnivorans TaxID=3075590 RepID=A0ABU3DJR6_9RHOB|nr:hypothetical protein [Roseicyclus sp. F158]MDT0683962.1 hypothetical protein [Roseicyclus sp. F158]
MNFSQFPKLSTTLIGSAIAAFLLAILVVTLPIRSHVNAFERNVQSEGVTRAGRALQLAVSKTMEREWRSLEAVAAQVDMSNQKGMQNFADAVPRASSAIAWTGIVAADGRIVAGTGGIEVGSDASQERWFREGRAGGSVSSVYRREALGDDSDGLINMSAPVLDQMGRSIGVVVYSLRIDWLTAYMSDAARELGLDIAVRDEEGRMVLELDEQIQGPLDPDVMALSEIGHDLTRFIPAQNDQPAHVLGVFPSMLQGELPHFGWDLVVRVPALQGQASLAAFMRKISWSIAALFVALGCATVFYTVHFLRPIEELSRVAGKIADGDASYPPERTSSRESAALSAALVRIQSRLFDKSITPAE